MGTAERKIREKNARREAILSSAKALFDSKGFDNTSVDEIVAKAEISKGTFYNYFPTKTEILGVLLLQTIQGALTWFDEMAAEFSEQNGEAPDPQEMLSAMSGTFMRYVLTGIKERNIFYILHGDFRARDLSEGLQQDLAAALERVFQHVDFIIQRGIDQGLFRSNLNSRKLALTVWGAVIGLHALNVKLGPAVIPDLMEDMFEEILNFVPKGLVK